MSFTATVFTRATARWRRRTLKAVSSSEVRVSLAMSAAVSSDVANAPTIADTAAHTRPRCVTG
eukprot:1506656-Rhodomonas_salina.1